MLTVDISRLAGIVSENLTQPVQSSSLSENVPELYRDPDNHWFGLTTRARIVYASKDRVSDGEIETYEELADLLTQVLKKWSGRILHHLSFNFRSVSTTV